MCLLGGLWLMMSKDHISILWAPDFLSKCRYCTAPLISLQRPACERLGLEDQTSYFTCHSRRCSSLEEWPGPSFAGRSQDLCWSAGSGSSHIGVDGRHPVYRQRHSSARGNGKGPSASLRECTHRHAPARTAPSSGGCLWSQMRVD